jgi:hypothetical protein
MRSSGLKIPTRVDAVREGKANPDEKPLIIEKPGVTVKRWPGRGRIQFETSYDMGPDRIWSVRTVLKEFVTGSKTYPQVSRRGGFCNGIPRERLCSAAWKIAGIARLDPINAQHERMIVPVPYIR